MKTDQGFRAFFEREYPAVYRSALLLARDPQSAEDATQEAFARAFARWRRLAPQPWAAGWVTTTAVNVARRQLRRRPTPPPRTTAELDGDAALDVRAAVRALPRRQQEAVVLFYLHDLPLADVAAVMGLSEGTVKTHLARARAALAEALADVEEPPPTPVRRTSHG